MYKISCYFQWYQFSGFPRISWDWEKLRKKIRGNEKIPEIAMSPENLCWNKIYPEIAMTAFQTFPKAKTNVTQSVLFNDRNKPPWYQLASITDGTSK